MRWLALGPDLWEMRRGEMSERSQGWHRQSERDAWSDAARVISKWFVPDRGEVAGCGSSDVMNGDACIFGVARAGRRGNGYGQRGQTCRNVCPTRAPARLEGPETPGGAWSGVSGDRDSPVLAVSPCNPWSMGPILPSMPRLIATDRCPVASACCGTCGRQLWGAWSRCGKLQHGTRSRVVPGLLNCTTALHAERSSKRREHESTRRQRHTYANDRLINHLLNNGDGKRVVASSCATDQCDGASGWRPWRRLRRRGGVVRNVVC